MTKATIHSTAIVEAGAQIGKNVVIEPFVIIKSNVILRDNVVVKAHAYIDGHTIIGEGTTIYPFASIGTKTQDLKFRGEKTFVNIGKNCEIREFVTINSSCGENTEVKVGDNCLIMTYCHIAHNCEVGNRVIMVNNASLAGHVIVEDFAVIGGLTGIHQFVRIGRNAMIGGMSRVTHDVPPFTIGGGVPYKFGGLNQVGLKRHGFSIKTRQALGQAFKIVYRSGLHLDEALESIQRNVEQLPEVRHFVQFCQSSKRGLMGLSGVALEESEEKNRLEDDCEPASESANQKVALQAK